ncbi:GNAT family N-acetyltransferase [Algicella marina]|uniref:GNAT family N-acetyltransferase n=1 Tax=Algicella marina TaxID=2683284 RepID=A0A6P1T0Z1_9RHOB|nr:GNAT family N-acetyltransferase [Algicella marina]QHQ35313.1 GNAT family N-acetyltransferase [Algicella marina]
MSALSLSWSASPPDPAAYCALRVACGLSPRTPQAATVAFGGSLHAVFLHDGNRLVGMGRVIGDGGTHAALVDIAVHPDYQRRGLGRQIVTRLNAWCDGNLPPQTFIALIVKPAAMPFYHSLGFSDQHGMGRRVP